jgi:DnaJ-class molecular chaperone
MDANNKIENKERRLFLAAILSSPLVAVFSGCSGGETCNTCKGSGKNANGVYCSTCSGKGKVDPAAPCTFCGGSGQGFPMPGGGGRMPCPQCHGTGKRNR